MDNTITAPFWTGLLLLLRQQAFVPEGEGLSHSPLLFMLAFKRHRKRESVILWRMQMLMVTFGLHIDCISSNLILYRSFRSSSTNKPKRHATALSCLTVNDEGRVRNLFVPPRRCRDQFVEIVTNQNPSDSLGNA